ncbi:hypothetical protein UFOVP773_1 [uncultured Caudovirales phage]|uniref:Uncharacterized protein n=1 Tax=uncultured Caudovirales phage TaxID=2100421 RepID=A0A6J5NNU0_9CAUD|nr:hypothetical protein UFOVP773_1 [uncultured Caudovirales phage]
MIIALDYDKTYTADPVLWADFIIAAKARKHDVKIVTLRTPNEAIQIDGVEVIYTSRQAKMKHIAADIWIDDNPAWVYQDSL